jgi:putative hydrolase of the HAD superfamily
VCHTLGQDDLVTSDLLSGRRAVIFDFFGTLTPVHPPRQWADNAARIAAVLGVSAETFGQALTDTFADRSTGSYGDVQETIRALALRVGVSPTPEQLAEASQLRRQVQEAMFALRPEVTGVMTGLRERGLNIGLLSDCTSELPDAWPRLAVAPLVDAPVFSCVEGTRKPDPRLFRTVAARLATEPADCLYVGDGGGNELTGASAVGMHAVLLAGQDWHDNRAPERWNGEYDWSGPRISSLAQLLD